MQSSGGGISLPTLKSTPLEDLGGYTWLLFGEKKIGKTSLAAQFPDALFLMFEPGGKGLETYQMDMVDWKMLRQTVKALVAEPDRFKTIIIDTGDIAYKMCMAQIGRENGFEHPSDIKNDFGKSWQMILGEFETQIQALVKSGRGIVFISHASESTFESRDGDRYNRVTPTLSNQVMKFLTGFVDIIAYYGYEGTDRILTIHGSDNLEAGTRTDRNFLVKGTTKKVHSIPMGDSPEEGYANIQKAFRNEQEEDFAAIKVDGMRVLRKVKSR